jgi:argininosuccinate synthase
MSDIKRVVLAYSGGLDTSVILKWLQVTYNCEVVTFTADLGQGEELGPARAKAELMGVKPEHIYIDDLREEFVRDFVFPMMRANARYEGDYLLGTSIARPLISKRLIEIARETGADAVSHGATGKGNDQVRFELSAYALEPGIKVIAPWREWDLTSRTALIAWAEQHQIPVPKDKRGEPVLHRRQPAAHLVGGQGSGRSVAGSAGLRIQRTVNPEDAPDTPNISRSSSKGRRRCPERRSDPRHPAGCAERSGPQAWHRPPRSGREPLRGHEVARHVRNAGRRDLCPRASRHQIDHAGSRRSPPQG